MVPISNGTSMTYALIHVSASRSYTFKHIKDMKVEDFHYSGLCKCSNFHLLNKSANGASRSVHHDGLSDVVFPPPPDWFARCLLFGGAQLILPPNNARLERR